MSYASTSEAAALAGVNVATVVRAAQLLGFSGWPALRGEARSRYLSSLSASEVLSEHAAGAESPAWASVRSDLRNLQSLSQMLDPEQVESVARLIHDAGTTVVLGSGSFAAPGCSWRTSPRPSATTSVCSARAVRRCSTPSPGSARATAWSSSDCGAPPRRS